MRLAHYTRWDAFMDTVGDLDYGEAFMVWVVKAQDSEAVNARTCDGVDTPLVCPDCGQVPETVCGQDEQGAWWRVVCECGLDFGGVGYRWKNEK